MRNDRARSRVAVEMSRVVLVVALIGCRGAARASSARWQRATFRSVESLPASLTWGEYIRQWTDDRGGWTQLANELVDRAAASTEVPEDAQSVERGLRRLATRGHKPGGQYGRWMLRYFGFVAAVDELVKWMGQYHTRFADLPCGFRLEHLTLWNRPPIAESRVVAWIHIGIAHAHLSRRERQECEHWLASAERLARNAGPAAEI